MTGFNMLFNRCSHRFGKVQPDGFQYCEKCGKAVKPAAVSCEHKWAELATTEKMNARNLVVGFISKLQCSKCGDMKEFKIDI